MGKSSLPSWTFLARVSYRCRVSNIAHFDAILNLAELSVRPDLNRQLVPAHCEPELLARSIDLDNFVPIPLEQLKISLD